MLIVCKRSHTPTHTNNKTIQIIALCMVLMSPVISTKESAPTQFKNVQIATCTNTCGRDISMLIEYSSHPILRADNRNDGMGWD